MSTAQADITRGFARASLEQTIAEESRRHRRQILRMGIGLAIVVAGAFAGYYALRPKPPAFAARFRTLPVSRGEIVREVHATGHVEAVSTVQVGAEISGRIATVEADYNQKVRQGQVLARFDRAALQAQLAQTAAAHAAAKTALAQAITERTQALRVRERATRLFAEGSLAAAERDSAEANAAVAEQRVEAAQAQIAAQSAANVLARVNLAHAEIRSPIDGIVITRNIDPGQSVASVLQAPTLFSVAADLRLMRVVGAVDEADVGEVHEEQPASFTVSAYPDREFVGKVIEVRNSPVVVQDVVTYGTVIAADNFDLALKPGMTASVRIRTGRADDVLRVPSSALHFTPPQTPAAPARGVWIVEGERLRHVAVRAGITDGEYTEIEAQELVPGTQVIVELTAHGRTAYGIGS